MFKVEWSGDGYIGIAAKTSYCYNLDKTDKDKYSAKGMNKTLNLSREHFKRVLETKEPHSQRNKGFIMKNNQMYTYSMSREGLNYFYCKRKVKEDGVSTTFLDI
ncbi:MAG: hypothetical protein HRU38_25285 [Saccharospirillaceae bacterium]|nr:hypothetical protein [Saccharospirillaceae bacterium]